MDKRLNEIILQENNDIVVNEEKLNHALNDIKTVKDSIETFEKDIRDALLKAMEKTGITKYDLDDFTISLVIGKPEEKFDEDSFLDNEDFDICNLFVNLKTEESFNIEQLKNEFPDVYKKCLVFKEDYEVDTKKLSKLRPDIYQKYVTYVASTRKPTIMIKEKKK